MEEHLIGLWNLWKMEQNLMEKHKDRIYVNWEWKIQPNDKVASLRDKKSSRLSNHTREDKQY